MSWKQAGVNFIRMAVLLVLVSMAAFFLVSVSPLDPLTTNVGQAALGSMSSEQIARLQEYWGVNTPPVTRYLAWAGDFLKGDMGISLLYRRPVAQVIGEKLANSLWIMAAAWILSGLIGFLMGIIAGAKKGKTADRIISSYALVTASTPAFWVALVLLVVFAVWLKLLPIGLSVPIGVEASAVTMKDRLIHGILPAAALSITGISNIALHTREKMAQVMVHYPQAWNPQHPSSCHDAPVCLSQRDIRRIRAGGAGIFLSGPGTGGCDSRIRRGCAAAYGNYNYQRGHCIFREFHRQPPVRNGGSQNQEEQGMSAQRHRWNRRKAMAALLAVSVLLLAAIAIAGQVLREQALATDFTRKNLPPSLAYPFGTDWMGRDMFVRSLTGLSISIRIGLLTACISAVVAFILGTMAACLGRAADAVIGGIIDLVMGIPHILLLILISFAVGKGFWGVLIGISLTHWTSLARLLRGEVIQLRESQYIQIAKKLGKGRFYIAFKHMTPHLLPQLFVGMVLLFPHAILHEASITFLGFGLPPEQPAVGVILSESMKYLVMGKWWLALFPGLLLVFVVVLFHFIGDTLSRLLDPAQAHL